MNYNRLLTCTIEILLYFLSVDQLNYREMSEMRNIYIYIIKVFFLKKKKKNKKERKKVVEIKRKNNSVKLFL